LALHLIKNTEDKFLAQSELYLNLRVAEGRLHPDEQVTALPDISAGHPHHSEWKIRKETLKRMQAILGNKPLSILEIGCGNGWLCKRLSDAGHKLSGADINLHELQQASRLFPECEFYYCDIFNWKGHRFDVVIFAASIQYFPDLNALITLVRGNFLYPHGYILVADSPVYEDRKLHDAAARSRAYYETTGFDNMKNHYFHHSVGTFKSVGAYEAENISIFERLMILFKIFKRPFRIYRFDK